MLDLIIAAVIGVAFGFALQRGGFCGSALFSSAVLFKDYKGLIGITAAICVSMIGFAALVALGWVVPGSVPLRLLPAVVGGLLFGVGMVLAGGCVTGTLFKAAEGRLTSILALVGIGLGAIMVDKGPLAPVKKALAVATKDLQPFAAFSELLELSFPLVGAIVGSMGLAAIVAWMVKSRGSKNAQQTPSAGQWIKAGWSPVTAGIVVGVLGWLAYLSSSAVGRKAALGGLGGVKGAFSYLVSGEASVSMWVLLLVGGLLVGSALSSDLRGTLKLRSADAATLLVALLGGLLVGVGAVIGGGCFIGLGVTGLALLSPHALIFMVCIIVANWVTTFLYLRGLQ